MLHAKIVKAAPPAAFKTFLARYFYFLMALLMAGLAIWGFSSTVDANLLHAKQPRPFLLWFHAAAFSAWIALFVVQSALVRVRRSACTADWAGLVRHWRQLWSSQASSCRSSCCGSRSQ